MAEPDSDARNAIEDEDLEDGEIETDEENEEVKPAKPIVVESVKKPKDNDSKKATDAKAKEHRRTTPDNTTAKSKKQAANDAAKGK